MANLQVKDIDDGLYEALRTIAINEKRSISQEVVHILETYLSLPETYIKNPTEEFLKLTGSWEDGKNADEIIADIKDHRKNSDRFGKNNELFN